jgi:7-cyano-7-deazaguanine synthase
LGVKRAILLSGGIDSAALAYWKRPEFAITVDYGQAPALAEIEASSIIAAELDLQHEVLRIDLRNLGSGTLAGRPRLAISPSPEWWPFRNQVLITLGAMAAIREGCHELLIGTVASDGLHADGSASFVALMDSLVSAQEGGLRIKAPAIQLESKDLVKISQIPARLIAWCHSCHRADLACGVCRGCQKSRETRNAMGLIT